MSFSAVDLGAKAGGMNDVLVPGGQLDGLDDACQKGCFQLICMATSLQTFALPPLPCLGLAASLPMPMLQQVSSEAAQGADGLIPS